MLFAVQAPLPWTTEQCVAMARCIHAMGHLQYTLSDHPSIQQVALHTYVKPIFVPCLFTTTADLLSTSVNLDALILSGLVSACSVRFVCGNLATKVLPACKERMCSKCSTA